MQRTPVRRPAASSSLLHPPPPCGALGEGAWGLAAAPDPVAREPVAHDTDWSVGLLEGFATLFPPRQGEGDASGWSLGSRNAGSSRGDASGWEGTWFGVGAQQLEDCYACANSCAGRDSQTHQEANASVGTFQPQLPGKI